MFFKHSKEKKKLAAQKEVDDLSLWFQDRMESVGQVSGVDNKLLHLEELKTAIDDKISQKWKRILNKVEGKGATVGLGSYGLQAAAITGAVVATGGALAPLYMLMMPGMLGSMFAGVMAEDSARKRLEREASAFLNLAATQKAAVVEMENTLLEDNMADFAKSPRRDDIFMQYPDLKSLFADVAARKAAEAKPEAPKPKSVFDNKPKP